jgi:hypothetical protein
MKLCRLSFLSAWLILPLLAQTESGFDKSSLAWRTALHFDPAAEAPLSSLIKLYQAGGKITELIGLYTQHLTQFPQDEGAKVVLARLFVETGDERAESFLTKSIAAHPQNALLLHTRAHWLGSKHDPRALEALDAAIALDQTSRRTQWLGELIKAAEGSGREDLITRRLTALAREKAFSPAQRLAWARRCLELGLNQSAEAPLVESDFSSLQGDEAVEARLVQSRVALVNGQRAEAATYAKAALDMLAADHWRRKEAMILRWQTADGAEQKRMLTDSEKAWKDTPSSETAALSHGDLLVTANQREEALQVWRAALKSLPQSRLIEERALELLDTLRQDEAMLTFLAERVKQQPERDELKLRRARTLLQLGRVDEGSRALDDLLAPVTPMQRVAALLQTARWLRSRNLFAEAALVLEGALKHDAQRWDVRKELAEVYVLLKKKPEMQRLFESAMPVDVATEVRMEVAQFLIAQKMWPEARRVLETQRPDFDALLLLAKVQAQSGDEAGAEKNLQQCRTLGDTEARYAAWLAAAWDRATEMETTSVFLDAERARLWPKEKETWDAVRLGKLSILAQQTMQSKVQADAEKLLRAALNDPSLPPAGKREMQRQLIAVLDGQKDQQKALETEIATALKEDDSADLRLRLALMYLDGQRPDLARKSLLQVQADKCLEATLIQRAVSAAQQLDMQAEGTAFAGRLVRLQPDERAHWIAWTSLLVQSGDETLLRTALREMRARAAAWKLSGQAQETLRRHLAASCWRTVSRVLAEPDSSHDTAWLCLSELEQTEHDPKRRLWTAWVRGTLALREGNETALAEAREALKTQNPWLDFPDGLSLSLPEARRLLEIPAPAPPAPSLNQVSYASPGKLSWIFTPKGTAQLQRWLLTPDGLRMMVQDSAGWLYSVDRTTGRLLWNRLSSGQPATVRVSRSGQEQVNYPSEWCLSDKHVCVLDETTLSCLSLSDAAIVWQVKTDAVVPGSQGCLTHVDGRVLWWRVALGRLDALDEVTGKLLWTCRIPPLANAPSSNVNHPVWLTSGIRADSKRVLVWGNGTAVVQVHDGALLWKVSASTTPISFPLELEEPKAASALTGRSLIVDGFGRGRSALAFRGGFNQVILANQLALPSYGYPGMYGSAQGSPWLLWGGDGERWLQGDGIWMLGQNITAARYSVLGLPVSTGLSHSTSSMSSALPVGTVGRALIVATETSVLKVLPEGQVDVLFSNAVQNNSPSKHPMPAVALDGHLLGVATVEKLSVINASSGSVLWESGWPKAAAPTLLKAREALSAWQGLRWRSRGVFLFDGQSRTLTVEWHALMAGGDFIMPVGTQALMCLSQGNPAE